MYFLIVLTIFLCDQLSKSYIISHYSVGESVPVFKNIFHITFVQNTGAAFGMFRQHQELFVYVAVISSLIIVFLMIFKRKVFNRLEKLSLCFILSGTLGNLADRIRFGYVVDFLDIRIWPVFNIADSFITIGALLLASYLVYAGLAKK